MDGELDVSVDNEVLDVFVATFSDKYVEHLRAVGRGWLLIVFFVISDENASSLPLEHIMQVRGVLLEDLTLVQQFSHLPDLVLGEVQNAVWVEVQVLHEEVNDLQSPFFDQNFSSAVLLMRVVEFLVCFQIFFEQFLISDVAAFVFAGVFGVVVF